MRIEILYCILLLKRHALFLIIQRLCHSERIYFLAANKLLAATLSFRRNLLAEGLLMAEQIPTE